MTSLFASHHPLLGFVPQRGTQPLPGNAALLSVARTLFGTRYFPDSVLLALHGHIHESKGGVRLGKTLAVNPGSAYEEGVLQAAIIELDPKKAKVKNYVLVNG